MTFDTDAINNIKFTQGFRGYDTAEVDEFLDDMIREIEKLNNTIKNLKEEVAKEKRKNQLNQQEIDRLAEMNESLSVAAETAQPEPVAQHVESPKPVEEPKPVKIKKPMSMEDIKGTPEYEEMKQVLTDTLLNAQQHAEKLVKDAQERANRLVEEGERKAQDRVVALNVEIGESQNKLSALNSMVSDVKQRYKRDFQNQIAALDSIVVNGANFSEETAEEYRPSEPAFVPEPEPVVEPEVKIEEKPVEEPVNDFPVFDPAPIEMVEEKPKLEPNPMPEPAHVAEEPKVEEPVEEEKTNSFNEPEVNAFDFAAIKKSFAQENSQEKPAPPAPKEKEAAPAPAQPNTNLYEGSAQVEDDNQQYIELALSAYNDNKHHNSDYPTPPSNIKINEDDDDGGIYQPENRSVLSSVIEEILNNKRDEE